MRGDGDRWRGRNVGMRSTWRPVRPRPKRPEKRARGEVWRGRTFMIRFSAMASEECDCTERARKKSRCQGSVGRAVRRE